MFQKEVTEPQECIEVISNCSPMPEKQCGSSYCFLVTVRVTVSKEKFFKLQLQLTIDNFFSYSYSYYFI